MSPTSEQGPAQPGADPSERPVASRGNGTGPPRGVGLPSSQWTRLGHLLALTSIAVAEPLYSVLKPGAAFFAVRRSQPMDLLVLVLALGLALPLVLWACQWVLGRLWRPGGGLLFGLLLVTLFSLLFARPLLGAMDGHPTTAGGLALALGLVCLLAYSRWKPMRELLSWLALAPLAVSGLFLFHPSIARIRAGDSGEAVALESDLEDAPTVVMLVLDELPITSLMKTEDAIDSRLFPNFAQLAADGTWFRNATTSHESTEQALPAILTGKRPIDQSLLPISADHPQNVFSMLGGSYRMKIWETFTGLCPASLAGENFVEAGPFVERMRSLASDLSVVYAHIVLPRTWIADLPSVTSNWSGFGAAAVEAVPEDGAEVAAKKEKARVGRPEKFKAFVDAVDGEAQPTFYFLHLLTPHGPWNRMPSGRRYDDTVLPSAWAGGRWPAERSYAALAFQRHLFQLGQVDRMLGALLKRLKDTGTYDRSLVVLVADHGINFTPSEYGRQVFPETARKLAHVPLFIKRPFQKRGRISDRNVETIDLLPTIADVVGLDLPWRVDGVSVFAETPARAEKTIYRRLEALVLDGALPATWPELERKRAWFGRNPSWESCFGVAVERKWIGIPVEQLGASSRGAETGAFVLDRPASYGNVDTSSADVPCHVVGRLRCARTPERILVALNGVVRAAGFTFPAPAEQADGGWAPFAAMIPAARLRQGANLVQLFGMTDDGQVFELHQEAR